MEAHSLRLLTGAPGERPCTFTPPIDYGGCPPCPSAEAREQAREAEGSKRSEHPGKGNEVEEGGGVGVLARVAFNEMDTE